MGSQEAGQGLLPMCCLAVGVAVMLEAPVVVLWGDTG